MQERVSGQEMLKARSFLFGILIPTIILLYKDYQHNLTSLTQLLQCQFMWHLVYSIRYCVVSVNSPLWTITLYRVSQELRSLLQDLIPELILSQKRHIHMGPIHDGLDVMSF